jgi:hypothetical protein
MIGGILIAVLLFKYILFREWLHRKFNIPNLDDEL